MSNLLLAHKNRIDPGTVAAGSWLGALPLTNVQDTRLAKVARTTNAKRSSTRFRCKFAANYSIRALAIINHNLSTTAKWRARAGRAPLDLLFDSDTLDERVTFSGGVNGTRVNKDGLIQAATRTNLAQESQTFDTATWTKNSTTVTANSLLSPIDNTSTADSLVETAVNATHSVAQTVTVVVGQIYTLSIYVFAGTRTKATLHYNDTVSVGSAVADLLGGSVTSSGSATNVSITPAKPGWFRVSLTITAGAGTAGIYLYVLEGSAYLGVVGSPALYLWGAQLEAAQFATDYIATTTAAVTVTDPRIDYDPRNRVTNLLLWSQRFDTWTQIGGSGGSLAPAITGGAALAPDNTMTASKVVFVANGSGTQSVIARGGAGDPVVGTGGVYTGSIYVKAFAAADVGKQLVFRHVAGTSYIPVTLTTEWQRVERSEVALTSNFEIGLRPVIAGGSDGTVSCYLWGAQLQEGSKATAYIPTTTAPASAFQDFGPIRTNLLPYSQEGDKWSPNGDVGWTYNVSAAPDGTTTADRGVGGAGTRYQTTNVVAGRSYVYSVYVKAVTGIAWSMYVDGGAGLGSSVFTFSSGALSAPGGIATSSRSDPAPNGFVRLSLVIKPTTSGACYTHAYPLNGTVDYWGAQLEEGSVATDYIQTFSTANTSPEGCRGLLVEEARTNYIVQSQDLTAAAWSGAPTRTKHATENYLGVPFYTATKVSATSSESFLGTVKTTVAGEVITATFAVKKGSSATISFGLYDGASWGVDADSSAEILSGPGVLVRNGGALHQLSGMTGEPTLLRLTRTYPTAVSAALNFYPGAHPSTTIGDSNLITRVQAETGTFPTSYIPTTTTPVTRTADAHTVTGANFSGVWNASAGTLYAAFKLLDIAVNYPILSVDDNTANEQIRLHTVGTALKMTVTDGGVTQADITIGTVAANVYYKAAITYAANSFSACVSGGTVQLDSAGTLPTVDRLRIGSNQAGAYMNGRTVRAMYWPEALTDAELQTITTSGPDAIGFNSGWVNALQMTFKGDVPANWGQEYAAGVSFNAMTAGYLTVEIDDEKNAAGYVQVGRAFAANGFQPATNYSYGLQSGREDLSTVTTSISGVRYATARRRPRTEKFSLGWATQAEADQIHEMQDEIGTVDEVFYIPDPADAAYSQRYGGLGTMATLGAIEFPYPLTRSIPFEWRQKI